MTTRHAESVARACCFAITLVFASASGAGASGQSVADDRFAGVLTIFEHASFRTVDGEIYSIRVEGEEAQGLIAEKVREADKSESLCLHLAFSGRLLTEEDFVGRRTVVINRLSDIETVDCR